MLEKTFLKGVSNFVSVFGVGGISQSVAGNVVARCADPNLTDEQFEALAKEVEKEGYELTLV